MDPAFVLNELLASNCSNPAPIPFKKSVQMMEVSLCCVTWTLYVELTDHGLMAEDGSWVVPPKYIIHKMFRSGYGY